MAARLTRRIKNAIARRPRFKRRSPQAMRLTDDDLAIIRHVGEHRFLRSTHLIKLIGRSADRMLRRLGTLYHNRYLDRPRAQTDHFSRGGSAPLVYALGNKGAAIYATFADLDLASVDWTDKNRDVKRPYIEHALMIADFMVALECAVREHPEIRLLRALDIVVDVQKASGFVHRSWAMSATVPGVKGSVMVAPDKVFGLEFAETGRRNYFLIEADRSTMPIKRPSLDQSSFKKKLLAYHHGHQAKRHAALWGIPGFRVLTLTKSEERIASMIDAVRHITGGKGSNVFLFTDANKLMGCPDPIRVSWTSGKGQQTKLFDNCPKVIPPVSSHAPSL